VAATYRLILNDDKVHSFSLSIGNGNGTGGTAWIDDVELVSPDGRVSKVIGTFDTTSMEDDTAWYNRAYGDVHGAASVVGAGMPVVRGEAGLDEGGGGYLKDMDKDTAGVWLHNNLWSQVNAGGMYDLYWWASETIERKNIVGGQPLYGLFKNYAGFMDGIPLSNGNYRDVAATTSSSQLRAWGQRDDVNGRMHLWVQNTQHNWRNVVNNVSIGAVNGSISIPNANGEYSVTWWDTRNAASPVRLTQTVSANTAGQLVLNLPNAFRDDIAVKIEKVGVSQPPVDLEKRVWLPRLQN
jgi:hypothetical protein